MDGQVENESIVDTVTWCGRLRRSTVPFAALLELLNFPFDNVSSPLSRLQPATPVWGADTRRQEYPNAGVDSARANRSGSQVGLGCVLSAVALSSISSSEKTRLRSVVPTCQSVRSHACKNECFWQRPFSPRCSDWCGGDRRRAYWIECCEQEGDCADGSAFRERH